MTLMTYWNRFKLLPWWQKALIFIPFILLVVIIVALRFMPKSDSKKFEKQVEYTKNLVDEEVTKNMRVDKQLAKQDKVIKEQVDNLKEEINSNEKAAQSFTNAINDAGNDTSKLLDIHRTLNKHSTN
jgi:predicted Holliday junction resolvase-like endonuclease